MLPYIQVVNADVAKGLFTCIVDSDGCSCSRPFIRMLIHKAFKCVTNLLSTYHTYIHTYIHTYRIYNLLVDHLVYLYSTFHVFVSCAFFNLDAYNLFCHALLRQEDGSAGNKLLLAGNGAAARPSVQYSHSLPVLLTSHAASSLSAQQQPQSGYSRRRRDENNFRSVG